MANVLPLVAHGLGDVTSKTTGARIETNLANDVVRPLDGISHVPWALLPRMSPIGFPTHETYAAPPHPLLQRRRDGGQAVSLLI